MKPKPSKVPKPQSLFFVGADEDDGDTDHVEHLQESFPFWLNLFMVMMKMTVTIMMMMMMMMVVLITSTISCRPDPGRQS